MFGVTDRSPRFFAGLPAVLLLALTTGAVPASAADPPPINPFGPAPPVRDDALPGYIELSNGKVHPGLIYLTRDKRLQILDEKLQRQREVPLRAAKQIECRVKQEWMEKEWKFKELASDEKMFTGRTYPAREYLHRITLRDGRTITGPLSGVVYLKPQDATPSRPGVQRPGAKEERFLLQKRSKGKIGEKFESLVYVKWIKLGDEALAEGRKKAAAQRARKGDS
ncbi:MAG: hypothetical protein JXB62_19725 [Pirellulales bacterium]|nr:hypothetical protein [Pirellulales bacterium]